MEFFLLPFVEDNERHQVFLQKERENQSNAIKSLNISCIIAS